MTALSAGLAAIDELMTRLPLTTEEGLTRSSASWRVTTEASSKKPVRALDTYTALAKTDFFKQYPYFARYTFAPGAYRGITEEAHTVGVPALWIANKDFSPTLVQKMAAAIYGPEGHAHMMKVHAGSKDMAPQTALAGITIPLHKGAEAHWKSAGVTIPESIRAQ